MPAESREPDGRDQIPPTELRIERFCENNDARIFDCGNKDLNDFLTTTEVAKFEEEKFGYTYLVYWQTEGTLVGYFTISNESLRVEYFRAVKSFSIPSEIKITSIPGINVGRLAVAKAFQKRGVGTTLMKYIAGLALSSSAASRVIFLEAYPESVGFYGSLDFKVIEHQKLRHRRNKLMYFDLKTHPEYSK